MLFDANTTQTHGRDLISFKAPNFGVSMFIRAFGLQNGS